MTDAFQNVISGSVTYAVRETQINGQQIHNGDYIGILDGNLTVVSSEVEETGAQLIDKMIEKLGDEEASVTLYYGSDVVKRGVEEALRTVDHVNISASESSCIELVAENCSKARTLEVLCGKLDITPAERLSMGAGENDFEQISAFFQYQQCQ